MSFSNNHKQTEQQDTASGAACHMDGLKVKISEKYKPPPRINLLMSYAQRLQLNKQIEQTCIQPSDYEFLLEKTVKEKLHEWRTVRASMHDELTSRVAQARVAHMAARDQEKKNEQMQASSQAAGVNNNYSQSTRSGSSSNSILMPTIQQQTVNTYATMLMPIPLSKNLDLTACKQGNNDKSPFNISDFEADTSSPFDNMELKSINEMEELAQVLTTTSSQFHHQSSTNNNRTNSYNNYQPMMIQQHNNDYSYNNSTSIPGSTPPTTSSYYIVPSPPPATTNYGQNNGYYYSPPLDQPSFSSIPSSTSYLTRIKTADAPQKKSNQNVPDIIKALQSELNNTHLDNTDDSSRTKTTVDGRTVFPKAKTKRDCDDVVHYDDDTTYSSLSGSMQALSRSISSMGFPLSRVARVCRVIGDDHKKIVEHLLAMSDLLDLGFTESKVSSALLQCDNDRDKALDVLIS